MITAPITAAELDTSPHTRRQLSALLKAGEVVRPFRGVYIPAAQAQDVAVRAAALAPLLPKGAAVARSAAAWLHGFDVRVPGAHTAPPPLEVVVPTGFVPPRRAGLRTYAASLPDGDVAELDGLLVTSLPRTAIDIARYIPPFMALAGLDAMARADRIDPAALMDHLERWKGERYVAKARRLISLCNPLSESAGESWMRLRVADAGFPAPELQIWVPDEVNGVYRLDMGWRKRRIGVEYDGEEFHGTPEQFIHDMRRRERLLHEFGWHVIGVHRGDVLGRSLSFERGIGELLGIAPRITRRLW
jgi:hypothetical protein